MVSAGYIVLGAVDVVAVYFLFLTWLFRDRPLTDMDRRLGAIDEDIDRRAREARVSS